jgi:prepilin-type N-terminal cleavage/methylation domain-containing protein
MKKGFTLIELLAVIVILAVIALIATPMILGVVEKAKKGAAEQGVNGYLDAIDKQKVINQMNSDDTDDINEFIYDLPFDSKYNIKVKGETPSKGWVEVTKKGTGRYSVVIGDYVVSYDGTTKTVTKGTEPVVKPTLYPNVVYVGAVNSATHIGYPIDANKDMGDKYVFTQPDYNVEMPFDSLEECKSAGVPEKEQCVLKNFKTPDLNYKASPDANWKNYLKITLNNSGIIEDAKACGKINGTEFCLERDTDGSKFNQNKEILLNAFGSDNCDLGSDEITCDLNSLSANSAMGTWIMEDESVVGVMINTIYNVPSSGGSSGDDPGVQ